MRRLILTFALMAIAGGSIFASRGLSIGISSGYVFNMIVSSTEQREDTEYRNGHGYDVAILGSYSFSDRFSLGTGIRFIEKRYSYERPVYEIFHRYRNMYMEFPFSAYFSFPMHAGLSFKVGMGVYAGMWLASYVESRQQYLNGDIFGDYSYLYYLPSHLVGFDGRSDNRFAFGLLASAALSYRIERVSIFVETRFQLDLLGQVKRYQRDYLNRYNHTLAVDVGISYGFGGER